MQTQIWFPDTCGCGMAIGIEGNQVTPLESDFSQALGREVPIYCPAHEGLNFEEQYNVVLEENNRKNLLIKEIVTNIPETAENILDGEGRVIDITLRNGVSIPYSFDENRVLVVDWAQGVSQQTKNDIKALVLAMNDSKITHI